MAHVWRAPESDRPSRPVRPHHSRRNVVLAFGHRASRWLLWTAAGVAVFLLLVWILSYAIDRPLTSYMERKVNSRLIGYTASLGRAHFNPFLFSVNLYDVSLVQDAYPDRPIADFPHIWADLEWSSLLRGRMVAKFDFYNPVLFVDRNHLEQEAKDETPVTEHGWQEALEEVYPFKINVFRLFNGTATYVDRGGTRPLELRKITIAAYNMRNVRSKDREYPSEIHAEMAVFDKGTAVLDGQADLLAEPRLTFKGDARLDQITLDYFKPVLERYHVTVRKGTLAAEGSVEYGRGFQNVELRRLSVTGLDADYDYRSAAPKPEQAAVEKTKEAASQVSNKPETRLEAETIHVTGAVGMVNRGATPAYRAFFSDIDLTVKNFSNHFSEGPATARATGKFMGTGKTVLAATFRPEDQGPHFDLDVKIDDTDMRTMNDMLRAYGKFDVARGLFSFYSELEVKNRAVNGYVKPLFRELQIYDRRKDAEKSAFRKLYLKLIGGVSRLLENRTPRKEVATKATIHAELGSPTRVNTWETLGNLVRNAFFRAILPGFDAEIRGGGKGEKGRQVSGRAAG